MRDLVNNSGLSWHAALSDLIDYDNETSLIKKLGSFFDENLPILSGQNLQNNSNLNNDNISPRRPRMLQSPVNYTNSSGTLSPLPDFVDLRLLYSQCKTISLIRDQGVCASCWAFASMNSITDRYCINAIKQGKIPVIMIGTTSPIFTTDGKDNNTEADNEKTPTTANLVVKNNGDLNVNVTTSSDNENNDNGTVGISISSETQNATQSNNGVINSATNLQNSETQIIIPPVVQFHDRFFSTQDSLECCTGCVGSVKSVCDGGYLYQAFAYAMNTGVSTGDAFGGDKVCKPYFLAGNATKLPSSPTCRNTCANSDYDINYGQDKMKISDFVYGRGEDDMKRQIYENGSIAVSMKVYQDFYAYDSGIYKKAYGRLLGGHAVRLVGYGEESGVKYWIAANSWGPTWGENGFFRIRRGADECGIESGYFFGAKI